MSLIKQVAEATRISCRRRGGAYGIVAYGLLAVGILATASVHAAPPTPLYSPPSSWQVAITWEEADESLDYCYLTGRASSSGGTITIDGQEYEESVDLYVVETWTRPDPGAAWERVELFLSYDRTDIDTLIPGSDPSVDVEFGDWIETFGNFPSKEGWESKTTTTQTEPWAAIFYVDNNVVITGFNNGYSGDKIHMDFEQKFWTGAPDVALEMDGSCTTTRVADGDDRIPVLIVESQSVVEGNTKTATSSVREFGFTAGGPSFATRYEEMEGFTWKETVTVAEIMGVELNDVKFWQWSRHPKSLTRSETGKVKGVHWEISGGLSAVNEDAEVDEENHSAVWNRDGAILHEVLDIDDLDPMEMMDLMLIYEFIGVCETYAKSGPPFGPPF